MQTNITNFDIDARARRFGYEPARWEGGDKLVETILNQVKTTYGFDASKEMESEALQNTISVIKRIAGKGYSSRNDRQLSWRIGDVYLKMERNKSGFFFELEKGDEIKKTAVIARDYLESSGLWEGDQALVDKTFKQIKSNFGIDPNQTENGSEVAQALIDFVNRYPFPPKDIPTESYQLDSLNIQIEREPRCFIVTMTSKAGELEKIRKQEFGFFM